MATSKSKKSAPLSEESREWVLPEAAAPIQLTDSDLAKIQDSGKFDLMFRDGDWILVPLDKASVPIYVTLPRKTDK